MTSKQVEKRLADAGFKKSFVSDSGSAYWTKLMLPNGYRLVHKIFRIRVSDHFVPLTDERIENARSAYDKEIVFDTGTPDEDVADQLDEALESAE